MRDSRGADTGEGAEIGKGKGAVTSPSPPLPHRPPPSPRPPRKRKQKRGARCQETPRRRVRGRSGAGRGSSRSGIAATRARGSFCRAAGGQEQSLGRGGTHTRLGERAPGAAPREGRCPRKGKRCSSLASLPRQLSGPVPNDGELPHPRNDRRRLLWARVQGAPEAQRPGEGRGLGLCCVWPGLISGASWVLRLCQAFGTRHPFGFLLTFLTSSCWHCVIWIQGT